MAILKPYLKFTGVCKEALDFYQDIFNGSYTSQTVGKSAIAKSMPSESYDSILHAEFVSGSITFFASDMMDNSGPIISNNISLCIVCDSEKQITSYYNKLSLGAIGQPFITKEFFGIFSEVIDKYGIRWMLQLDKSKT